MLYKIINVLFGTHQWKIIYRKKNNSNWIEFNQPKNLSRADPFLFYLAPIFSLVPAFAVWSVIPFAEGVVIADINIGG